MKKHQLIKEFSKFKPDNWFVPQDLDLSWFPGHMKRGIERIKLNLDRCDVVIEMRDIRAPLATKNIFIENVRGKKPHIIFLNKVDLVDDTLKKDALVKVLTEVGAPDYYLKDKYMDIHQQKS